MSNTKAGTSRGTLQDESWVGTMTNWWMVAPSIAVVLAGLIILGIERNAAGAWMALGLAAVGIATSVLSSIRVTVDRRGVQVEYGPLHFPRTRIAAERIAAADVIEVRPVQWGGWGYRGSVRVFKKAAVVLRKGPGLRLRLRNGAQFAVTVPDAEPAAALLNRWAQEPGD